MHLHFRAYTHVAPAANTKANSCYGNESLGFVLLTLVLLVALI